MTVNFPNSPTNNQIFIDPATGNRYVYDAVRGFWRTSSNLTVTIANAAYAQSNAAYNIANLTIVTANAAYDKANAANVLAFNTGIGANSYAGSMANSSNNFAGSMANGANAYSGTLSNNSNGFTSTVFGVANAAFANANGTQTFAIAAFNKANTALQNTSGTIAGDLTISGLSKVQSLYEKVTVSATAATGTVNFDVLTQGVLYYTTNASGNWTLNIRGNSSVTLDSTLAVGQSITVVFLATQGATAYYASSLTIDGVTVTPKWQGGTAATVGNINSIDSYSYTIIKTGSSTYTALVAQTKFA